MKVLHIISSAGMYGAEMMLLNLASAQTRLGAQPVMGVFRNKHCPPVEVVEKLRAAGLRVEEIPCSGKFDTGTIGTIRRLIRSTGADLVHAHGYKGDIYSFLGTRFLSIPLLSTAHNWTGKSEIPDFYNQLDRLVLRRFSCVAAVSGGVEQRLQDCGVAPTKIVRIANGIDLNRFHVNKKSQQNGVRTITAGLIGRLVPEKGCEHFLRAAAKLTAQFPQARFALIGQGPDRASLETLAHSLNIEQQVAFWGHRDDMPAVYEALDFSVLPSFEEGMPMTILEAMAAGKPVVATPVGEIPNMVEPEVDGLLTPWADVNQLSDAMARLFSDHALRVRMGANGRQKAERLFSSEAMARSYLELYERLCGKRLSPAATSLQRA